MLLIGRPGSRAAILFAAVYLLSTPAAFSAAAPGTAIEIGPGPKAMTAEEKALAADPSKGAQHGIILVDETVRMETRGTETDGIHHVRAKIFCNEARSLADIEIDFDRDRGVLKKWWGTTILPDGTVLELKQDKLVEQELAKTRGSRYAVLKASLPGVVPGCVIDYGYHFQDPGYYSSTRVDIQRSAPVQQFRYRWVPYEGAAASFRLSHAEGLPITTTRDMRSVLVTATQIPAVLNEPHMPPEQESHAAVTFYYRSSGSKPEDFWNLESKRLLRRANSFAKEKPIAQLVASMNLPAGDLRARVKAAYDDATANFRNTTLQMREEAETANQADEDKPAQWRTVQDILPNKQGTARDLDYLFYGIAKALGAEVSIVLATDRTDHYFDPGLLSISQFDWTLVGVKAPGEPDDNLVYVDLGSGLPFGEIPWWLTGSRAFMATPSGHRVVLIYPSNPTKNLLQTTASISFSLDEGTASMKWTKDGSGQQGLSERWWLRGLDAQARGKALEASCGASGDFEVSRAEAPRLQELAAGYHLECEGTLMNTNLSADLGSYRLSLLGPYVDAPPRFTAPTRSQVAIFQFPTVESLVLDVKVPEGFLPGKVEAPPPVESPFGRYALFITATPEGFHVERMYALTALVVPAGEYAALKKFFADVAKADETRLVFERPSP